MRHVKNIILFVVITLMVFGLLGCPGNKSRDSITVIESVAANPGVVFGKIIDRTTRAGIAGATVFLKVDGAWRSVGTAGPSDNSITDTAGDFAFSGVPVNTNMVLVVKGPDGSSYVTIAQSVSITSNVLYGAPNNEASKDLGQIALEKGVTVTLRVVDAQTGNFITKSDGSPLPIYINPLSTVFSIPDNMATRDATDTNKYTIIIPQTGVTIVFVPSIDINADGKYDYTASSTAISTSNGVVTGQGSLTTVIALTPVTNTTTLSVVTDNVVTYGSTAGGATTLSMIGKSDPINIFFNMPVTVAATGADAVTLTYTDNFKYLTATAVTAEQAVTVTQGADNCLLTITPSAALIEGQTYALTGSVASVSSGASIPSIALNNIGPGSFGVKVSGATVLSAAGAITLDNRNYWTNGSVITAPAASNIALADDVPYLFFPAPVWGTVRAVSHIIGTTTTVDNGAPVTITGQVAGVWYNMITSSDPNIAVNGGTGVGRRSGANRSGVVFPVNISAVIGGTVADNTTATPVIYTLGLNVYDANGNTYVAETAFPVQ